MENKIFYYKKLHAEEYGLMVVTYELFSIRETPCFYFCMPKHEFQMARVLKPASESLLQYAKRKRALKRIAKSGSRIAFETEEKALEHLRFLKKKQLGHMRRETAFITEFLKHEELETIGSMQIVPNSEELVSEFLCFN